MDLTGKGFFIWKVQDCEGGDPAKIAQAAQTAGFSWVALKIANGTAKSNRDPKTLVGLLPPVVAALRKVGIRVWGWHYVYGYDPLGEAAVACEQINTLALDGYIIDAEAEYKLPGRAAVATQFMNQMRSAFPVLPMAICSYRYPTYHPEFPWDAFLAKCDLNMPQVYWEQAHDPTYELTRSVNEFNARGIKRPIVPIGPTYKVGEWAPTAADLKGFEATATRLGLSALGYFSWDECRRDLPGLWPVGSVVTNPVTNPVTQPPNIEKRLDQLEAWAVTKGYIRPTA